MDRALGLIVDSIASMPWAVYRDRERLPEPRWLADPQNAQGDRRVMSALLPDPLPSVAFRGQLLTSLVMHGEAFVYHPNVDPLDGYPLPPVFLLNPVDVDVDRERAGRFRVKDTPLDPALLLHVRGRAPYTDEGRGVGVLARHADTLRMGAHIRGLVSSAFRSGVPAGYLKVSAPQLTQDQADTLKRGWLAAHGGGTRSIAVLNATTEFSPLSWDLAQLRAVEMGAFSDRDIAHAFGMSAHYLDVVGDSNTYANVQDRAIDFRMFTLLPWARLVESALETRLPAGHTLKIKLEGLERANLPTRDSSYATRIPLGVMTVDEARDLEDLPPLPEPVEGESDADAGDDGVPDGAA